MTKLRYNSCEIDFFVNVVSPFLPYLLELPAYRYQIDFIRTTLRELCKQQFVERLL